VKKKSNTFIIIIILVIFAGTILIGYGGWKVYQVLSFVGDARQMMGDTSDFWENYESKPQSYYENFAQACTDLLHTYGGYTDYPFYIPTEDNPTLPPTIVKANPKSITVWSRRHMSVTVVSLGDNPETGIHITCKGKPDGTLDIFLGVDSNEGYNVFTSHGM
jgi:hypothetical protein